MKSSHSFTRWHFINCLTAIVFIITITGRLHADEEDTYAISLKKTVKVEKILYESKDKKVMSQLYTVQKKDSISAILKKNGLLNENNKQELFNIVHNLNKSLENLDLIHPGQKLLIPIKIVPRNQDNGGSLSLEEAASKNDFKLMTMENYEIKAGDHIIKVIRDKYNVPDRILYDEYLKAFKKLNPSLKNLDKVFAGQSIRLPIYHPNRPVEISETKNNDTPLPEEEKPEPDDFAPDFPLLAEDIGTILIEMGEDWIQKGEHFIPLTSGGQINLEAESFPIVNIKNGNRIIVDLKNNLPDKMTQIIESSWNNYHIVHLLPEDDLKSSLRKILTSCNYNTVRNSGEPFELKAEIPITLSGDFVVATGDKTTLDSPNIFIINLNPGNTPDAFSILDSYLKKKGVKIINFPQSKGLVLSKAVNAKTHECGTTQDDIIKTLLGLCGLPYTMREEIPVYQSKMAGFKLLVRADFLIKLPGKNVIIDFSGIDSEMHAILKEHDFDILSLSKEKDPLNIVTETLKFIEYKFNPAPYMFKANMGERAGSVTFSLPGVVFSDKSGNRVIVLPQNIPEEIIEMLIFKGYSLFTLPVLS